jgi:hypothetical protein
LILIAPLSWAFLSRQQKEQQHYKSMFHTSTSSSTRRHHQHGAYFSRIVNTGGIRKNSTPKPLLDWLETTIGTNRQLAGQRDLSHDKARRRRLW